MTQLTLEFSPKPRQCSLVGCERPLQGRGYCGTHYARWRKYGDAGSVEIKKKHNEPCSIEGCDRRRSSADYCEPHYKRAKRNGTPGATEIKPWHQSTFDPERKCSKDGCDNANQYRCGGFCQPHYREQLKAGTSCLVDGCGRQEDCKGYCRTHYQRWKKSGDPGPAEIKEQGRTGCLVEGCDRPHNCQGYCQAHYIRFCKTGTPGTAEIATRAFAVWSEDGSKGTCADCGETKKAEDFYRQSSDPQDPRYERRLGRCRECVKSEHKAWRAANPELLRQRQAGYARRFVYGLEPEEYEAMLAGQGGTCAICGKSPGRRQLAVDHCHETGGIRGLLCSFCNTGLGLFKDDADLIDRAASYLEDAA